MSFWNSTHLAVYNTLTWDKLSQINVQEVVPFNSLQIETFAVHLVGNKYPYLVLNLRSGVLLLLNLFPQCFTNKALEG
jgi:hypothetical protein